MPNLPESVEDLELPMARVRKIMKSSVDNSVVPLIKLETLHLVSRAAEMLIKTLAKESIGNNKTLEYKHVADYVQSDNNLEFLQPVLPKKITGKTFLKLLNESDSSDESEDSDSGSDESENSDSGSDESKDSDSSSSSSNDDIIEISNSDSDPSEKADDAKK